MEVFQGIFETKMSTVLFSINNFQSLFSFWLNFPSRCRKVFRKPWGDVFFIAAQCLMVDSKSCFDCDLISLFMINVFSIGVSGFIPQRILFKMRSYSGWMVCSLSRYCKTKAAWCWWCLSMNLLFLVYSRCWNK